MGRLALGIERAGRLSNLPSHPTKSVLIGTEMGDGRAHLLVDTKCLNGHPIRCASKWSTSGHWANKLWPTSCTAWISKNFSWGCKASQALRVPCGLPTPTT